jgi:hypothetical protein
MLLLGASSRRRVRRCSSWSKGDRSHLRRRLRFLPAAIRWSSTTSRLLCHFGGPSALVQQAPASTSQVVSSPETLRLAVLSSSFVMVEKEWDLIAFFSFTLRS